MPTRSESGTCDDALGPTRHREGNVRDANYASTTIGPRRRSSHDQHSLRRAFGKPSRDAGFGSRTDRREKSSGRRSHGINEKTINGQVRQVATADASRHDHDETCFTGTQQGGVDFWIGEQRQINQRVDARASDDADAGSRHE